MFLKLMSTTTTFLVQMISSHTVRVPTDSPQFIHTFHSYHFYTLHTPHSISTTIHLTDLLPPPTTCIHVLTISWLVFPYLHYPLPSISISSLFSLFLDITTICSLGHYFYQFTTCISFPMAIYIPTTFTPHTLFPLPPSFSCNTTQLFV